MVFTKRMLNILPGTGESASGKNKRSFVLKNGSKFCVIGGVRKNSMGLHALGVSEQGMKIVFSRVVNVSCVKRNR